MTLPTESSALPGAVGTRDGDVFMERGLAVLDSFVCQDMRWCVNCAGEQVFVEVFHVAGVGRVGFCFGCGEEKIVPFSRVNSEAA